MKYAEHLLLCPVLVWVSMTMCCLCEYAPPSYRTHTALCLRFNPRDNLMSVTPASFRVRNTFRSNCTTGLLARHICLRWLPRRLTGFFLGGHDRDLYIKCTSSEFANLPMIDVMQGGCIMTCSHFEKAAGRELSKK